MGHDVEIIIEGQVVHEMYITGNFYSLYDRYEGVYDFHGHTGTTVARIIRKTLQKMTKDGYSAGIPDKNNHNWYWGLDKEGKNRLCEKDFTQVFFWYMQEFLTVSEKYPTGRFYSDQVFRIKPYSDDDGYKSDGEEKKKEESESE